jgi:hypothetical protein
MTFFTSTLKEKDQIKVPNSQYVKADDQPQKEDKPAKAPAAPEESEAK